VHCHPTLKLCVQCVSSTDCSSQQKCQYSTNTCVAD